MGTMNNASCCNLLPCMNELGRKLYGVALDGAYMERLRGSGCWSRHLCLRCCCLHLTPWGWRCWALQWVRQQVVVCQPGMLQQAGLVVCEPGLVAAVAPEGWGEAAAVAAAGVLRGGQWCC